MAGVRGADIPGPAGEGTRGWVGKVEKAECRTYS